MKNRLLLSLGLITLASGSYLRADFNSELKTLEKKHQNAKTAYKDVQKNGWGHFQAAQINYNLLEELEKFEKKHGTKATDNRKFKAMKKNLEKLNNELMSLK